MKYQADRAAVTLSVRELCALAFLPRHLDLRYPASRSPEDARLGSSVHQRLQAEAGALYTPEVTLCHTEYFHGIHFEISGRADGIISGEIPTVDEIKTVKSRASLYRTDPAHEAQLKC